VGTEHDDTRDRGRREFLKQAGKAAWTVPAIQVVNMTGALAGTTNTSVTTTTMPPTTRPPECVDVLYRLKAEWTGDGWAWVKGEGANDCLTGGTWTDLVPTDLPVMIEGDDELAVVTHDLPDCEITMAAHKAGTSCVPAQVDGTSAIFTAGANAISHIELVVECCEAPS
jgi:hypothetical protein